MGSGQNISHGEYTTWFSPALTLGLLGDLNFENVVRLIHPALSAGEIRTAAATATVEEAAMHLVLLPASIWKSWDAREDLRFWVTGNLILQIQWQKTGISAYGIRFDPVGLVKLFPSLGTSPKRTSPPALSTKGGRPAGKNGEPIAGIAKRLIALTTSELASYTAEAVAAELIEEYRRLGLQPPSSDNAKRDAAGVLRAVRN